MTNITRRSLTLGLGVSPLHGKIVRRTAGQRHRPKRYRTRQTQADDRATPSAGWRDQTAIVPIERRQLAFEAVAQATLSPRKGSNPPAIFLTIAFFLPVNADAGHNRKKVSHL
jgi:hypothetical protein